MESAKILIVEDDPIIARAIETLVEELGHRVTQTLAYGEAVMDAVAADPPDLIIVDILLKGSMTGIDVAEQIGKQTEIPLIYLTGNTDALTLEQVKKTSPHGFLTKPLQPEALHVAIETAWNKLRAEQRLKESEVLLSATFQSIQDGLSILNLDLSIRYANPVMEKWYRQNAPLQGQTCHVCFHGRETPCDQCPALRSIESGQVETAIVQAHKIGDSDIQWLELSSYPIYDSKSGKMTGVVEFARDITQRKCAEEQLQEKEERYRSLFDNINAAAALHKIITDDAGKPVDFIFLDANQAYEEMTRLKRQDIVGKRGVDVIPNLEQKWIDNYGKVALTGESMTIVDHSEYLDKYWEVNAYSPQKNQFAVVFNDITERMKTRQALEKSEARFRNIVEASPMAMYIYHLEADDSLVFRGYNEAANRQTGVDNEQFMGKRIEEAFPSLIDTELPDRYRKAAREGEPWSTVQVDYDDEKIQGAFEVHAFQTEPGKMAVLFMDITHRKQAEEALMESENKFRSITEQMSDMIFLTDARGTINLVSPASKTIFGYEPAEMIGNAFVNYLNPSDVPKAMEAFQKGVTRDIPTINIELNMKKKDGSYFAGELSGRLYQHQSFTGTIGMIRDISDRKRIEAEREDLIISLEGKNAEMERFLYTVSHDLKSPMITITGFLGLMQDALNSGGYDALPDFMERIKESTHQMEVLLKDLLELSRIGRVVNPSSKLSMSEIAGEAVSLLEGLIEKEQVLITVQNNMPEVLVDRVRMQEVYINLIENAIKYSKNTDQPMIQIGVETVNGETQFFVKDNGMGIESDYHQKIFGLFEQLDQGTEGTGIGLALVKRIIQFHGGRIHVVSAGLNQGTTFYFTLPDSE